MMTDPYNAKQKVRLPKKDLINYITCVISQFKRQSTNMFSLQQTKGKVNKSH